MKKSKFLAAVLAATMFTTAAGALVACGDEVDTGKTYTVTFDADGGTLNGEQTLKTDVNGFVKGTVPTADKADTTFQGWSLSKGDDTIINFKSQKFTSDKVVYAVYGAVVAGEVTITYNYGDGNGSPASAQTVNGKLTSLPTPTPPQDQTFSGWYTAAIGGEYVTTNTTFTQSGSIYAHYKYTNAALNNYCVVGNNKYTLTSTTITGAAQAYSVSVQLNAGDTVSFYIDAELIEAQRDTIWIGMVNVSDKTGEFTAARQGTFEFKLGYYPATAGSEEAWRLEGDDGVISFHANHYYLVGGDYGWQECAEDGYIGATSGSFELTVDGTPVSFKLAKCGNEKTGAILWDDSVLDASCVTKGLGYISSDNSGNIVLKTAGTYTITLKGGKIEITSDLEEPDIKIFTNHYYIVGEGIEGINWNTCVEAGHIGETSGSFELTVGEEPVRFKLVKCKNISGAFDWDSALGMDSLTAGLGYVTTDDDGNFVLETAGTYTIKLVDGKIEITSDVEEPDIKIFVNHYYFVGGDLGWGPCVEAGHLGATSGEIEVTVGEDLEEPFAFKVVKCNSVAGGIDWGSALGMSAVTAGKGYVTIDGDGNFVLAAAGTYTIKLVNGKIEITSDDVEEGGGGGGSNVDNSNLTFEECSGVGAWLVGVIQEKDQTWTTGYGNGYKMVRADDSYNQQYKIEVYLQAGDEVKIRFNKTADTDEGVGYSEISNSDELTCVEDEGGNIAIKKTGKYTFYFKFTWTSHDRIYIIFEEAE